jgi:hypothetical protein
MSTIVPGCNRNDSSRLPGWRAFRGLAALAVAVPLLVGAGGSAGKGGTSVPAFGHEVVVDHQRVAGEPSISISPTTNGLGYHDLYVSAPFGFSTTASFIWKSKAGGQTFHMFGDQSAPEGKPAMA